MRTGRTQNDDILITGTASGLGHSLHQAIGGIPVVRGTDIEDRPYEAIIHCAANTVKSVPYEAAYGYVSDNVLLTQRLVKLRHRRFIYISSIDVPRGAECAGAVGLYANCKLMSEAIVGAEAAKPLILRPTTLMGPRMRPNSIFRMLTEPHAKLYVSAESRYNLVLHSDICTFIRDALDSQRIGVVEIAASASITLGEIARQLSLTPQFGQYRYDVGDVTGANRPSCEALNAFIDDLPCYIGAGRLRG